MSAIDQEKYVVWDFTGTMVRPDSYEPKARPELTESLKHLNTLGFKHLVWTGGERQQTEKDLKMLGLNRLVTWVIGRKKGEDYQQKKFTQVLDRVQLPTQDVSRKMIVIGDDINDRPGLDVLFILHTDGYRSPADAEIAIIKKILELNASDLGKGFDTLYNSLGRGRGEKDLTLGRHRFTLEKSMMGVRWQEKVYYDPKIIIL